MKKLWLTLLFFLLVSTGARADDEYIIFRSYYTPPGDILDGAISADSRYIVGIDKKHSIRIWRYQTGRLVKTLRSGPHKAVVATM
ncbi:MAG: hypothetical protein GY866_37085, partial [Proteobacteria bacterium]|nr:hypothetical protein [Pseudomonadota bacterium]